jgi:intein/homing endonuclease
MEVFTRNLTDTARIASRRQAAGVASVLDFGGPSGSAIPGILATNSPVAAFLYTISRADKLSLFRYWARHDAMVGRAIELHSELPMSRVTIGPPKGPSPRQNRQITRIYESMGERLDILGLMLEVSREYWLAGDVYLWCNWSNKLQQWDDVYVLPVEFCHSLMHPFNRKKEIIFFAKPLVDTAAVRRITDRDMYMVADTDIEKLYEALGDTIPPELKEALNYGEAVPLNTNWRRGSYCIHVARNRAPNEEYGECCRAGTRVLTSEGYLKIEDHVDGLVGKIHTEYGAKGFDWVQDNGIQETVTFTTRTNNEIGVTLTHGFRVMGTDGILRWKRAAEIREGDYILCQRGDGGLIPEDRGEDPKTWEAAGLLWGDGSQANLGTQHQWIIPEGEEETLDWLEHWLCSEGYTELEGRVLPEGQAKNCMGQDWISIPYEEEKLFRVYEIQPKPTELKNATKVMYSVYTVHPVLREILPEFAPRGTWRRDGFPEMFWRQGRKQMAGFLRGLFSTDGSCGKGDPADRRVSYCNKYENVIRDAKRALLLFGIVSTVYKKVDPNPKFGGDGVSWHLRLLGHKSNRLFKDKIGFLLSMKNQYLEDCCDLPDRNQRTILGYPHATELVKRIFPPDFYRGNRTVGKVLFGDGVGATIRHIRNGKQHLLADTMIEKILDRASECGQDKYAEALLREYVKNDWWFDRVDKIERSGLCRVYDPVNTETKSYISEGVVSHNSIIERCMDTLLRLENLKNSNLQISSRNMNPKHIVTAPGTGKQQMDDLRAQIDLSMLEQVDYPIVTNFEVNWNTVGANDRLLNTENEYNLLRQDLALGLGSTVEMLTGQASYSGNRITLEMMNTCYLTFRDKMRKLVEVDIFRPVADALGHYQKEFIDVWPRVEPEEIEEGDILSEEEDGQLRRKRTMVNVLWNHSTLRFNRISIRDNAEVYDQLFQLYQKGSLAVRYLLDLHNIDPEENARAILEDIGGPKDPVFNDFVRAVYTATDMPQKVLNDTDFMARVIKGLHLVYKAPSSPTTQAGGGGLGGGGGGGLSDIGGTAGGDMGMGGPMGGEMGGGFGEFGFPGEAGAPGGEMGGAPGAAPGGAGGAPTPAPAPAPAASRRTGRSEERNNDGEESMVPGRILSVEISKVVGRAVKAKAEEVDRLEGRSLTGDEVRDIIKAVEVEARRRKSSGNGNGKRSRNGTH